MDSRRRWLLLSVAFAGTVAAIFYPVDEEVDDAPRQAIAPTAVQRPVPALPTVATEVRSSWIAADADPFASKAWQAPLPVAEVSRAVQPVVVAEAPPPPPPPLPFKFVGQMNDGSDSVVYLSKGDQVVVARSGDLLDGGYKVSAISPTHIEFETVSSGFTQPLAIPAKEN
jgi:hypothetical protein